MRWITFLEKSRQHAQEHYKELKPANATISKLEFMNLSSLLVSMIKVGTTDYWNLLEYQNHTMITFSNYFHDYPKHIFSKS